MTKICHNCGRDRRMRLGPFCSQACAAKWAKVITTGWTYCRKCEKWFDEPDEEHKLTHARLDGNS